jgi:hypothetical protein
MNISLTVRFLTSATALSCALSPASGQLTASRRSLVAAPPSTVALGHPVTLSVQGAPQGSQYRYAAVMLATAMGDKPQGSRCAATQNLGTGTTATWRPTSGTYRLTARGPVGPRETDTLSATYVVQPRRVMLASAQSQAPSGGIILMLRTDDLGPGHTYLWSMHVLFDMVPSGAAPAPAAPPLSWTTTSSMPMVTYPTPVAQIASIKATVGIHQGDPCVIVAAGAMPANQ